MNRRTFFAVVASLPFGLQAAKSSVAPFVERVKQMLRGRHRGRTFVLESRTIYVRREPYMLEFFMKELPGRAVGNVSPDILRARFD